MRNRLSRSDMFHLAVPLALVVLGFGALAVAAVCSDHDVRAAAIGGFTLLVGGGLTILQARPSASDGSKEQM